MAGRVGNWELAFLAPKGWTGVTPQRQSRDLLHLRQDDILKGGALRFVVQAEPKRP